MATVQELPAALSDLVRKLAATIDDASLARRTARLVRDHAADEQLALATMLKLAEESPSSMREALSDSKKARELIICLGASEIVASEVSQAGSEWLRVFDSARTETSDSLLSQMRCVLSGPGTRADAARQLSDFKRRIFLKIAIADLTGQIN